MTNVRPRRPWRVPFRAERVLPSGVVVPWLRAPFRRDASDWAGVGQKGMETSDTGSISRSYFIYADSSRTECVNRVIRADIAAFEKPQLRAVLSARLAFPVGTNSI